MFEQGKLCALQLITGLWLLVAQQLLGWTPGGTRVRTSGERRRRVLRSGGSRPVPTTSRSRLHSAFAMAKTLLFDTRIVDIPRYWLPTDSAHQAKIDTNGFLATSYSFTGDTDGAADKDLISTSQLGDVRGMILLGPPGSGKSIELARLRQAIPRDAPTIAIELGSIADAADLRLQLHEHATFKAWKDGHSDLVLFLDSIDEGVLSIENLSAVLKAALKDGPGARLRIHVTCRAADWPAGLGRTIQALIGKDETQTLTLVPLRARDALAIAEAEPGVEAASFLSEVVRSHAGPLASLPLTLKLLFEVYRRRGQLPEHPAELYEQATLYLCEESNLDRQDAQRTGDHDATVRQDVATRIAGLLRLAGKPHFDLGSGALVPSDTLTLRDLASPAEAREASVPTDGATVRDLVRHSGLFEPSANQKHRFAHAALGEFLAARFLYRQETEPAAALALLSHPDGGLKPQLRQVAAWLASLNPEFFALVAQEDPEAALLYVVDPPPDQRGVLLQALVGVADRGAIDISDVDDSILPRLDYDGIAADLRAVFKNSKRFENARRVAIKAAIKLELKILVPDLLQVALDSSSPQWVRTRAVRAVEVLGSEADRVALRPLAQTPRREDPARRIAMAARHSLFPQVISVSDLIAFAREDAAADENARNTGESPPPPPIDQRSFTPNAHAQLVRDVIRGGADDIPDEDLFQALRDLALVIKPDAFEQMAAEVFAELTAEQLPNENAARALAELLLSNYDLDIPVQRRLPRTVSRVTGVARNDTEKRRALMRAIVDAVAARNHQGTGGEDAASEAFEYLLMPRHDLVEYSKDEVEWLLDQLNSEVEPAARPVWIRLVQGATIYKEREIWEPVLNACLSARISDPWFPDLFGIYLSRFAARDTEGKEADEARKHHREWNARMDARNSERVPYDPPLPDQLDHFLADASLSMTEKWGRAVDVLERDPEDARRWGSNGDLNPTGSKLWKVLNEKQREELITLAKEVLRSTGNTLDKTFSRGGRVDTKTRLVLEAVALLAECGQFDPSIIPEDARIGITVVYLTWPFSLVKEVSEARDALRDDLWSSHKDELVDALADVAGDPEHAYDLLVHLLPRWDERLSEPFVEAAHQLPTTTQSGHENYKRKYILDKLLGPGVDAAADALIGEIAPLISDSIPLPADEKETEEQAEARLRYRSTLAFVLVPDRTWDLIGDRFKSDDDFARGWLWSMASRVHDREYEWPDVSAQLTGLIYRRMYEVIPPSEDVQRPSVTYSFGRSDYIQQLRRLLIGALTSRASAEDVGEVRALHRRCPGARLERAVANVEQQYRRLNPAYPSPAEVLRIATNPRHRPIRSDAELQQAVIHALESIQERIAHDQQRDAAVFWSPAGHTKTDGLRPRDENFISDRIAVMLRDALEAQGITVNRESESNRYDQTDILVQAPPDPQRGRAHLASVTVEVKGSWNPELLTALSSQLVDRYLQSAGWRHGIYLVALFDQEHWTDQDYRKQQSERRTRGLQATLAGQVEEARGEGYRILTFVLDVPSGW